MVKSYFYWLSAAARLKGPLSNNTVTHCSRIARMSDTPPKRTRGKRGGDPFRRSQVNRKAAGLVSHLDYHDPDSFEADRIAQERREERSRSVAKTGAVAKGPIEPRYPPRAVPAASVAGGESRRGVPQRQVTSDPVLGGGACSADSAASSSEWCS